MNAIENDIRRLHVVGTTGVAAHLGLPAAGTGRLVLAAPRTYRVRGELVTLPHVIGAARRPLRSTATVEPAPVARAA